jgi:radical SAM protein with 4Fe4S-binding SPASM domain
MSAPGGQYLAHAASLATPTRGVHVRHVDCEITERCDNACTHCYLNLPADDTSAERRELSTERWWHVLREAADLGALTVRFTGGEPLLRADFPDLYMAARRLGLGVILFTNARRVTSGIADLLARVPPRAPVEVTMYGMSPASYTAVACRREAHEEAMAGVARLRERGVPLALKWVRLPANTDESGAFAQWAAGDGEPVEPVVFLNLRGRRDSATANRRIARMRLDPEEGVGVLTRDPDAYRRAMRPFLQRFMGPPGERIFGCGAGRNVAVDAYGRVQMCLAMRHPAYALDLAHVSLREIVGEIFPRWRAIRARNADYLARCARCFLKSLCNQCPARAWAEHGALDTPVEYHCAVAHAKARALGLLHEGEQAWTVEDWRARIARAVG